MNELNSGKKAKEVATDLSISTSSVYRCKRHAKEAAKAATKSSMQAKSGKEAPMAPMAAPSSAMAAPAAARFSEVGILRLDASRAVRLATLRVAR